MIVPATIDAIQEAVGKFETIPEIRVWVHPHKIGSQGSDTYITFSTFLEALVFIEAHPEAEKVPLVAFRGYELNLWDMRPEAMPGGPTAENTP